MTVIKAGYLTVMAERILNLGGGAYKRAPEGLTYRGSGDIWKIIILCIFCLKLGV